MIADPIVYYGVTPLAEHRINESNNATMKSNLLFCFYRHIIRFYNK